MKKSTREQIAGYREITEEIAVLRKHGTSPTIHRGDVKRTLELYHPPQLKLSISEVFQESKSTSTLRLVSESGYLPPFQAGQYINLFLEIDGIRTSRPFSISSPPNQIGYYDITVRRVDGGFVSTYLLDELKVGDHLTSTSPAGDFVHNPLFHGEDLVFIAGGSGITPFISMIREVTERGLKRDIHLIYGSRSELDIVFEEELVQRSSQHENLRVSHVIMEPSDSYQGSRGLITAELIKGLVPSFRDKMFYVCGPEAMYSFVLEELALLGVERRRIRLEAFGAPSQIDQQPGWPQEVKREDRFVVQLSDGSHFEAMAGETLLNSLEKAGKVVPTSCRTGECSLCRTKLLAGKVFHPATVKLRKSDRRYNYIHPCLAYPLEDLKLML